MENPVTAVETQVKAESSKLWAYIKANHVAVIVGAVLFAAIKHII